MSRRPSPEALVLGALALVVAWGLAGFSHDDAFITFRYARSWLEGDGLVYNPGERVFGTSAPGYALLLAWLARGLAPLGLDIPEIGTLLSVASLLAIVAVAARAFEDTRSGRLRTLVLWGLALDLGALVGPGFTAAKRAGTRAALVAELAPEWIVTGGREPIVAEALASPELAGRYRESARHALPDGRAIRLLRRVDGLRGSPPPAAPLDETRDPRDKCVVATRKPKTTSKPSEEPSAASAADSDGESKPRARKPARAKSPRKAPAKAKAKRAPARRAKPKVAAEKPAAEAAPEEAPTAEVAVPAPEPADPPAADAPAAPEPGSEPSAGPEAEDEEQERLPFEPPKVVAPASPPPGLVDREAFPKVAALAPPELEPAPPPTPWRPRHIVYIDVENTSSEAGILSVLDGLDLDGMGETTEVIAIGNWRVVAQGLARTLAERGAQLVHSAPALRVRDWSDLWIAVQAGIWLGRARAGDTIVVVSHDRAFDAIGDAASRLGVHFRRVTYRDKTGAISRPASAAPEKKPASGRRRRSRSSARSSAGGAAPAKPAKPSKPAPSRAPAAKPAATDEGEHHPAPPEEIHAILTRITKDAPEVGVPLDRLSAELKAAGFLRPPNSPRLVTRLKRFKDIEVLPGGRVRLTSPGAAPEPKKAEAAETADGEASPEPAKEGAPPAGDGSGEAAPSKRRRSRRGGRRRSGRSRNGSGEGGGSSEGGSGGSGDNGSSAPAEG